MLIDFMRVTENGGKAFGLESFHSISAPLQRGAKEVRNLNRKKISMLWTIFVILLVLWLLGFTFHIGNLIHLLLVIALVVLIIQLLQGRRPL